MALASQPASYVLDRASLPLSVSVVEDGLRAGLKSHHSKLFSNLRRQVCWKVIVLNYYTCSLWCSVLSVYINWALLVCDVDNYRPTGAGRSNTGSVRSSAGASPEHDQDTGRRLCICRYHWTSMNCPVGILCFSFVKLLSILTLLQTRVFSEMNN